MRELLSLDLMWLVLFCIVTTTANGAERSKKRKRMYMVGGPIVFSMLAFMASAYAFLSGVPAERIYDFFYHIVPAGIYMIASIVNARTEDEGKKKIIYWIMAANLMAILGFLIVDIVKISKMKAFAISVVAFIFWVIIKVRNVNFAEFFADRYEDDEYEE